ELRKMQIHRLVAVRVGDLNHVPFAALASGKNHSPASDRLYRRSNRRAIIRSHVRAIRLQNRMESRFVEVRSYWRAEFERRTQKCFLQRLSVGSVISRLPCRVVKQQRLILPSAVVVFGRKNLSVRGSLPVRILSLFEHDSECVTLARIGVKIKVVSENLR